MRAAIALALPLALLAGCSGPHPTDQIFDIELHRATDCNPFGATEDACLLPYPSSWNEQAADTPTGVRFRVPASVIPQGDGGKSLDPTPYTLPDGASPVTPILLFFAKEIALDGLPGIDDVGASVEPDAPIALVDLATGERVPFFAEMDRNVEAFYPDRYAFILRPVAPMAMGHRHAVFVKKGLATIDGEVLQPTEAFAALRDGMTTTHPDVERVRPATEAALAFGDEHGYPRGELLVAWDFQVASEAWLLGSVLSMREKALAEIEQGTLGYVVTSVENDPNPDISRIVKGTFEVPTFCRDDGEFDYDADHHPIRQPDTKSYPFTMLIPKKAAGGPLPLVMLGHGIFGSGEGSLTGGGDGAAVQKLAQEMGGVVLATDWIGLSSNDLPHIASSVASDLNRIGYITDRLQQALVNTVTLTKLGLGDLSTDPALEVVPGQPLVDPEQVYYWGASLGGIEGSGFVTISPDVRRAAFGVPGSAWATMLTRSIVFPPLKLVITLDFPDPLDLTILTTLAQVRFDHADPANLTTRLLKDPLPGAPPGRVVLLQEAYGDCQVPNVATDILVRAMGVSVITPAIYEPFGVPKSPGNNSVSAVQQFKMDGWDMPFPPKDNLPPEKDNDVHHGMNFLPKAQEQIGLLFFTGNVAAVCDGVCDPD